MAFQARGRLLRRPTVVPVGRRSRLVAHLRERGSSLVVYANPHDHAEIGLWERLLGPGDLFVDVGANVGSYSMWAAELGAEVVAFEPDAGARARLRANARLNGFDIDIRPQIVSATVGRARMTRGLDAMNHIAVGAGDDAQEATTLDVALAGRTHVRGVKVDVEGFERLVLEGAEELLREHRIDVVQLEWNRLSLDHMGEPRGRAGEILTGHGYHLLRPDGTADFRRLQADVFAVSPACLDEVLALVGRGVSAVIAGT